MTLGIIGGTSLFGTKRLEDAKGRRSGPATAAVTLVLLFWLALIATTTTAAGATSVNVDPATQVVTAGGNPFSVNVTVENVTNMGAYQATLNFEPTAMNVSRVTEGDFLKSAGTTIGAGWEIIDNTSGFITLFYALTTYGANVSGSGTLATIEFNTNLSADCTFNLNLTSIRLLNGTGSTIHVDEISNGTVTISALTDLVITDTWVCWPDNCTICYNITNTGNGTVPAGHNTTLYVDGVETAQDKVPVELAPNASYTGCFDYTWAYTPPNDDITICADYNNTVEETNEDNNWLNVTWKCGDVNNDKAVNILDVIQAYNKVPSINEWAADVNADKAINILDVIKIYTKSGLICCCD